MYPMEKNLYWISFTTTTNPSTKLQDLDFPKLSTINPSSMARTFEAKRKEDKVSPRCSCNRQNVGFPKKVSNMDAKY